MYYNYRYYNSGDGRWNQNDIFYDIYLNTYIYNKNDTIYNIDYIGLSIYLKDRLKKYTGCSLILYETSVNMFGLSCDKFLK